MLLENKYVDLVPLVGSFSGGRSSIKIYTKGDFQLSVNRSLLVLFSPLVRDAVASVGCCKTVSISIPEVSLEAVQSLVQMLEYGWSYTSRYSSEKVEEIIAAGKVMGVDLKDLKVDESYGLDHDHIRKKSETFEIEKLLEGDKKMIKKEYSEVPIKEEPSEELLISVETQNTIKDLGENISGHDKAPPSKRARTEVTPTPTTNFPEPTPTSHFQAQPARPINQHFGSSFQSLPGSNPSPYQFGSPDHNLQANRSQFQSSPQFGSPVPMQGTPSIQRMVPIQSSSSGSPSMVPIQLVSNPNYIQSQMPNGSPNYTMQHATLRPSQPGPHPGPMVNAGVTPNGNMMGTRGLQTGTLVQQVPCTGPCCPQPPHVMRTNMQQFQAKTNQQSYQGTSTSYQPSFPQNQYKKNQKTKSVPWNAMSLEEKQSITCPDWNRGNCTRQGKGDDFFCFFMGRKLRHSCSRLVDNNRICWGKHREHFHQN